MESTNEMKKCPSFENCSANLCPLDPALKDRVWYSDEDVCTSRRVGQHRWVRKQRSIKRRHTKSWLNRPVTWQELYDASRQKQLSQEQLHDLKERLAKIRERKTLKSLTLA